VASSRGIAVRRVLHATGLLSPTLALILAVSRTLCLFSRAKGRLSLEEQVMDPNFWIA